MTVSNGFHISTVVVDVPARLVEEDDILLLPRSRDGYTSTVVDHSRVLRVRAFGGDTKIDLSGPLKALTVNRDTPLTVVRSEVEYLRNVDPGDL